MRTPLIGISISLSVLALSAQAQAPTFTAASVVNAASMVAGPIAPGMIVDITGSNLGDPSIFRSCANANPVSTAPCFGISVLVNGAPAPVLNNSATQLVFQVPFGITGANATIQVTSSLSGATVSSGVVTVPLAGTAPALFTANFSGTGTAYYYDGANLIPQYSQAVLPGDTVVLYGTGFGATNPAVATGALGPNTMATIVAPVTMTLNNQSVPVTAGLEPGNLSGASLGWDEVIFAVPSGLTIPAGKQSTSFPVVVTVGGVASQTVNLIVGNPLPSITAISPNPVPATASAQTVTFNGSGFQSGLTLKLISPSAQQTTVAASNVNFVSATQFTAQITVGTTAGNWGALVLNPDGGTSSVFNFLTSASATTTPTITSIVTTSSNTKQIAQNTWIEVHGTNLAQVSFLTWANSDFSKGLPTTLGGVSATVDGKAAPVYFVSPTQINILAPLDSATGSVPVQVTTPNGQSPITTVTELPTSPAFLIIDPPAGHVAAEHLDYSYIGPSSLNAPGYTFTAAKPGETVALYAVGFGQTNPAITDQAAGVGNALPTLPQVTIGGVPANVIFAGISGPGLYQLNVVVPNGTADGDAVVTASYNGSFTQSNVLLAVHQ